MTVLEFKACFFVFFFFFLRFRFKKSRERWEAVWSRFSEPWDLTAVRTVLYFYFIEGFLRLKEPEKWTVRGFSSQIVWFGPGFKNLFLTMNQIGLATGSQSMVAFSVALSSSCFHQHLNLIAFFLWSSSVKPLENVTVIVLFLIFNYSNYIGWINF